MSDKEEWIGIRVMDDPEEFVVMSRELVEIRFKKNGNIVVVGKSGRDHSVCENPEKFLKRLGVTEGIWDDEFQPKCFSKKKTRGPGRKKNEKKENSDGQDVSSVQSNESDSADDDVQDSDSES